MPDDGKIVQDGAVPQARPEPQKDTRPQEDPRRPGDSTPAGPGQIAARKASSAEAGRLMRLATYASLTVAASLIGAKFVAWILTDSVSLLSTLVDSILDILASLVSFFAVRHALEPPDREHRFGHGKAEPLAALCQSAFIAGSALFLLIEALDRFFRPHVIEHGNLGIAVMVFSILLTFALVQFQGYVVRKTGSLAIQADSLHYVGDLLVNFSVIVALVLVTQFDWLYADALIGLGIVFYILYQAWKIAREAYHMLMDRELPDDEREKIKAVLDAEPELSGFHDLKTRRSGRQVFIQVHLEMNGDKTLYEAHRLADLVEEKLLNHFPEAEIIIHQDPDDIVEEHTPIA